MLAFSVVEADVTGAGRLLIARLFIRKGLQINSHIDICFFGGSVLCELSP